MLFSKKIKQLRKEQNLLQRHISSMLDIDNAIYSKIECGKKLAKKKEVKKLANILQVNEDELINIWLADQIYEIISNTKHPIKVLNIVAESIVSYQKR